MISFQWGGSIVQTNTAANAAALREEGLHWIHARVTPRLVGGNTAKLAIPPWGPTTWKVLLQRIVQMIRPEPIPIPIPVQILTMMVSKGTTVVLQSSNIYVYMYLIYRGKLGFEEWIIWYGLDWVSLDVDSTAIILMKDLGNKA